MEWSNNLNESNWRRESWCCEILTGLWGQCIAWKQKRYALLTHGEIEGIRTMPLIQTHSRLIDRVVNLCQHKQFVSRWHLASDIINVQIQSRMQKLQLVWHHKSHMTPHITCLNLCTPNTNPVYVTGHTNNPCQVWNWNLWFSRSALPWTSTNEESTHMVISDYWSLRQTRIEHFPLSDDHNSRSEKSALDVARDWADNEIFWMIKDAYDAAPKPKKDNKGGGKKKPKAPSTPKPLTIPPIPQVCCKGPFRCNNLKQMYDHRSFKYSIDGELSSTYLIKPALCRLLNCKQCWDDSRSN